jgi:POT family proton-dependent oligopeptide transporter
MAVLASDTATKDAERRWFGHPPGLTILFLTEMWEKFSYFGMRALLVYYMTKALAMRQEDASWVYGGYTSFAYFTPILGGLLADRWLGRRRAVILGGSIMAVGHFLMAFPALFYPALATIAIGNGFFLPSLPSQVRHLYAADDPRGNTAFSVYYVGINLGAVLAPLVCGTLGELYGITASGPPASACASASSSTSSAAVTCRPRPRRSNRGCRARRTTSIRSRVGSGCCSA